MISLHLCQTEDALCGEAFGKLDHSWEWKVPGIYPKASGVSVCVRGPGEVSWLPSPGLPV